MTAPDGIAQDAAALNRLAHKYAADWTEPEQDAVVAQSRAALALRDLAAYDAPKVPTLLEAAKVALDYFGGPSMSKELNSLKAAIEREEGGAK